ncbi:MAG: hypothetical protein HRU19_23405 [Pseudobacteriovorax sp.]|nr:hypothetical protein [Pseudobacteriovorax sp.]
MFLRFMVLFYLLTFNQIAVADPVIDYLTKHRVNNLAKALGEFEENGDAIIDPIKFSQVEFTSTSSASTIISGISVELIIEISIAFENQSSEI